MAAILVFLAVSRFLKFAILNCGKSFRIWTPAPTPRASLCMGPGGSVKGAGMPERAGASEASLPVQAPTNRLGRMSGHGWAPLQAQLPLRGHSIQTVTLLCRPSGPRWPWRGDDSGFFGRESIFKFSHTKSWKKFQNLDLGPDSTRKSLHGTRWVYVGGRKPDGSG
jgi:hypothetical protein